jgi:hypothetical protein
MKDDYLERILVGFRFKPPAQDLRQRVLSKARLAWAETTQRTPAPIIRFRFLAVAAILLLLLNGVVSLFDEAMLRRLVSAAPASALDAATMAGHAELGRNPAVIRHLAALSRARRTEAAAMILQKDFWRERARWLQDLETKQGGQS